MGSIPKLNPKQQRFLNEYLKSRNATQSAKVAGYSKKTAHSTGPRLLEHVGIKAAIEKSLAKATEKAELKAADVLAEIRKLAFVDLSKAYAPDGALLHPQDMPEDVRAALQSVESDELFARVKGSHRKRKVGVTKKIKLADKVRSLEMLAKHFKLLTDVQEVTGKDGGPQVILNMPANGSEAETE